MEILDSGFVLVRVQTWISSKDDRGRNDDGVSPFFLADFLNKTVKVSQKRGFLDAKRETGCLETQSFLQPVDIYAVLGSLRFYFSACLW